MEETKGMNCLVSSFCINPKIRFETQDNNENIILLLRAHPITKMLCIFNAIVLLAIVIILSILFSNFLTVGQMVLINGVALVFILSYIWFNFLEWYFNAGIVTNERIVDIDFSNVTYKEVSEAKLTKIEDITSKSSGYFSALFNYGDIFVQTAGELKNIEFYSVPKPTEVVDIISDLLTK